MSVSFGTEGEERNLESLVVLDDGDIRLSETLRIVPW